MVGIDNIICVACQQRMTTNGKTVQIYDEYDNARRVNVHKCPSCGIEVYASMGNRFDVTDREYKGDVKLECLVG